MKKNVAQPSLSHVYKKLLDHGESLWAIQKKLLDHDEELTVIRREMLTKNHFNQTVNSIDKILLIVTRLDQERVFTAEWIRRIERDVEKLKRRLQVV